MRWWARCASAAVLAAGVGAFASAQGSTAGSGTFPSPPANATVFSRQLGNNAVALAVVPEQDGLLRVQASVIGTQGNGVSGLPLAFTLAGSRKVAGSCGAGCYRATFRPRKAPRTVDVELPGAGAPWHVALPAVWPPRGATALIRRAGAVWRGLHSLSYSETLGSGTGPVTVSTWRIGAPDRLAYEVRHGGEGIVIGSRRWDRAPGSKTWQASAQTPLRQPVPFWVSVTRAHVLGNLTYARRAAVRVSFFDPDSRAWFTLVLDRRTLHTLDSRMVTNAHFMHDVYGSFNTTPAIVPPS